MHDRGGAPYGAPLCIMGDEGQSGKTALHRRGKRKAGGGMKAETALHMKEGRKELSGGMKAETALHRREGRKNKGIEWGERKRKTLCTEGENVSG